MQSIKTVISSTINEPINQEMCQLRSNNHWDFPGGPVVGTLFFHCRGTGSIPGWETRILQRAAWCSQKKKKSQTISDKVNGAFDAIVKC